MCSVNKIKLSTHALTHASLFFFAFSFASCVKIFFFSRSCALIFSAIVIFRAAQLIPSKSLGRNKRGTISVVILYAAFEGNSSDTLFPFEYFSFPI